MIKLRTWFLWYVFFFLKRIINKNEHRYINIFESTLEFNCI